MRASVSLDDRTGCRPRTVPRGPRVASMLFELFDNAALSVVRKASLKKPSVGVVAATNYPARLWRRYFCGPRQLFITEQC